MPQRTFRFLLVTSLILGVSGFFLDSVLSNTTLEYLSPFQDIAPTHSLSLRVTGALLALLAYTLQIIASVGLYLFRSWSRVLALVAIAMGSWAAPLVGYSVKSGAALSLMDFSTVLWGGVIAMAYYSPLRRKFIERGR